jgi:hypothetical protein
LDAETLKNYGLYGRENPPYFFLIRSKADGYIRNIAKDMSYDADED